MHRTIGVPWLAWFGAVACGCSAFSADTGPGATSSTTAAGIPCGATRCSVGTEVCCVSAQAPSDSSLARCTPESACPADRSTAPLACDKASDCGGGDVVCCLEVFWVGNVAKPARADCRASKACLASVGRPLCDPKVPDACLRHASGEPGKCAASVVVVGRSDCGYYE